MTTNTTSTDRERIAQIFDPGAFSGVGDLTYEVRQVRRDRAFAKADKVIAIIAQRESGEPVAWLVTNGADTFVTMMRTDAETWGRNGATIGPLGPIDAATSQALAEPVAWQDVSTAPHACHVLAARFDDCEWVCAVVMSPPSYPFTHWMPLPSMPGSAAHPAPAESQARIEALEAALDTCAGALEVLAPRLAKMALGSTAKACEDYAANARALLSGSTPKPAGVDPSERDVLRLAGLLLLYAINSEDASAITVAETGLRSAIRPAVSWSELWSVLADGAPKSTVDEALTAALSGGRS